MSDDAARQAKDLSSALKDFHRALIHAEIGDDPALQNPYTALFSLIGDPRFAWMGPLSRLIVRLDETIEDGEADMTAALQAWRDEVAIMLGEGASESNAEFRLRHLIALQKEPEVGLATGRLRRTLERLPAAPR